MTILDTCALIYDALSPELLSKRALKAINEAEQRDLLACSDISLWEIAMLVEKGRLEPGTDCLSFIRMALAARTIKVLPINPEIAHLAASSERFRHHDPADRIIAATTMHYKGSLVTSDGKLQAIQGLKTIW